MLTRIKKFFVENKWICLYRSKQVGDSFGTANFGGLWRRVQCESRYWCADPFIVEENGKQYVFCEMMDLKTSHGVLGLAELNPNGDSYARPIADLGCHVSYPNVFKVNDIWYMIPETSGRKNIELYQAVDFPTRWEKQAVLAQNIHAVDTTVFEQDGKWYVFIYEPNGANNTLSIAELELVSKRLGPIKKIKQYTCRIGRPAGNVFWHNGHRIRPTQFGVHTYGERIVFKEFLFDPISWKYEEKDIREMMPTMVKGISRLPVAAGCHTYNCVGNIEIIDIKYSCFSLFRPLRILMKYFHLGGYRFYEQK